MENHMEFTVEIDTHGTHFLSYLFDEIDEFNREMIFEQYKFIYSDKHKKIFEENLAKLISISNQKIFEDNDDKSIFCLTGKYRCKPFTIYDYKGDRCFHIGGNDDLDVLGLKSELIKLIKNAAPTHFNMKSPYTNELFSF